MEIVKVVLAVAVRWVFGVCRSVYSKTLKVAIVVLRGGERLAVK